jgi:hypothetical protein
LSSPVLRHETGETLGQGKLRLRGEFETTRVYPLVPPGSTSMGVQQQDSIFSGTTIGVQIAYGLLEFLDIQGGSSYLFGGAGWRLGAKWGFVRMGRWSVAIGSGYGRFSGTGSLSYGLTDGTLLDTDQTLSATRFDLSLPVSYRLSPMFALYSGVHFFSSAVDGSTGAAVVSESLFDFGANFGVKFNLDWFEGDLEIATINVDDPFLASRRWVPYYGFSGGIRF